MSFSIVGSSNSQEVLNKTRLLLHTTDVEPETVVWMNSKEMFSLCKQDTDPLYYGRPLEERFEVAMSIACGTFRSDPEAF